MKIWYTNETSTAVSTQIPVSATLRYLSVNGGQGFQTVAYWHGLGLPDFNICGQGHPDSGSNSALIPVSVSFTGVVSRVTVGIVAYASNERVRTFRWRIASGRTDLSQGQTLYRGVFSCPYGSSYVTINCPCPGSIPETFYIYLEPWTGEYGNIHITRTVDVRVYLAAGASAFLDAEPYIYHNGIYQPAAPKIFVNGWRGG